MPLSFFIYPLSTSPEPIIRCLHLNLTSSSRRFPPPLSTMRGVDLSVEGSYAHFFVYRAESMLPVSFTALRSWVGEMESQPHRFRISNSNIFSEQPSYSILNNCPVRKSVLLPCPFIVNEKPTWQKRQGSWLALDCCTPDSLRSSAGTWQTTFWCKKYDKSATVLYMAASALPGSWYLTFHISGSCNCTVPSTC